jgi:hypothetical protein
MAASSRPICGLAARLAAFVLGGVGEEVVDHELGPAVAWVGGAFGVAGPGQPLHLPGDVRGFHFQPGC